MGERVAALVVGAGPAGTALALALDARGHRVLLIDKARFPRDKCCSEYASPATLAEINALPVGDLLATLDSSPLSGSTIHTDRGDVLSGQFPGGTTGRALPRRTFDAAMVRVAAARGITVHEQTRLVRHARAHDGTVRATIECDGATRDVHCRVLVGADGLRSRVARTMGGTRTRRLSRIAFVTHIGAVQGLGTQAELHVGPDGYVGLNPIAPGRVNLALVTSFARAAAARGNAAAHLRERIAAWPALRDRIDPSAIGDDVMVTGPFDHRSRRVTADGVALVGDAADFFDPFTGEGIWAALVGARLLAATLDPLLRTSDPITHRALAPYRSARRTTFRGKWIVERTIGHAMRWPALFRAGVRRLDRAGLGDTAIAICGDCVPARMLISPGAVMRLVGAGLRRPKGAETRP